MFIICCMTWLYLEVVKKKKYIYFFKSNFYKQEGWGGVAFMVANTGAGEDSLGLGSEKVPITFMFEAGRGN